MTSSALTSRFALSLLALAALPVASFAQGALVPAGAPAPMMKTLAQIEARVDVATLPGDATAMHVISQPGSYYLTADVVGVAGKGGIRIEANNVSLDLNGFTIWGPGTSNTLLPGIYLPDGEVSAQNWIAIRNGFVRQWGGGGVHAGQSGSMQLADLRVYDVASHGIYVNGGSVSIERCMVSAARETGIYVSTQAGVDAIVRDCVISGVSSTGTAKGIYSGYGLVQNCRVRGVNGAAATGIDVDFRSGGVVTCDVSQVNANVSGSYAVGIDAPLIRDCNISDIAGYNGASGAGVYATYPTQVIGTHIANISGQNAMGIYGHYAQDDFLGAGTALVQSCTVTNISGATGAVYGIFARTVLDCQISAVQGTNAGGAATGIYLTSAGLASRCSIMNTEGHGIDLTNGASAVGNSINSAGKDGSGAGIYVNHSAARAEGNRVSSCQIGVQQVAATALVIGNFAQGNTTNYSGVNAALITTTVAGVAAGSSVLNVSF